MRPRIEPAEVVDGDLADTLSKTLLVDGRPLNVFLTIAHHPRLLKRFNALGGLFLSNSLVPPRIREIVILRTAWRTNCVYEFGQHTTMGLAAGVTMAEISRLTLSTIDGWGSAESAVIAAVDALHASDCIEDATYTRLAAKWNSAEIIELLMLAGFYRMLAGFLNSVGVQPESGLPGWPLFER